MTSVTGDKQVIPPNQMQFSIRQLMIAFLALGVCFAGPVSWYRWYNHEITDIIVGEKHRVCFRSKYEEWRGPRRVLDVRIYENDTEILNLTCRVTGYHNVEPPPKIYYSKDRNFVCVTYPGDRNYILGDLSNQDFATRYLGTGMRLATSGDNELTPRWQLVFDRIKLDNPDIIIN